ncbi:LacI family transcriptional regulator [Saccharothrix sp. MB29]|nr:LacI family transcriptional regulator [Saccharothrix sp. MB29]
MASRQVTLQEVAKHAGVSLATASRVLNGSTRQVSEELRERVLGTARGLGYLPNASAQALARTPASSSGWVHDIADPYFSSIAAGVTRVAEAAGLVVVLGTTAATRGARWSWSTRSRAPARAVVIAGSAPPTGRRPRAWRRRSPRSPSRAAGSRASRRRSSARTPWCPRTGRARGRWPGSWPRSATGGSRCSAGRPACSPRATGWPGSRRGSPTRACRCPTPTSWPAGSPGTAGTRRWATCSPPGPARPACSP